MNQLELEANTRRRRQARKFLAQSQSVATQNQSNREIAFDTQ